MKTEEECKERKGKEGEGKEKREDGSQGTMVQNRKNNTVKIAT